MASGKPRWGPSIESARLRVVAEDGRTSRSVRLPKLSSKERERLAIRAAGARRAATRQRATILIAAYQGAPVSEIAKRCLIDPSQIHAVIREFNSRGFESLTRSDPTSDRSRLKPQLPIARALVAALLPAFLVLTLVVIGTDWRQRKLPEAVEVSADVGIREVTYTWGATAGDFDGDDREDVMIAPHKKSSPPPRLYRNVGGHFERIPAEKLPSARKDHHDCDWGNVDDDGLQDLYCSVGGGKGTKRNSNVLWVQQADGSFVDEAAAYRVTDLSGRGRDVAFLDANGDGLDDLFVANAYPRQDGLRSENKLFINVRGERFREAREYGLNRQIGGSKVEAADYNDDGWTDLILCGQKERVYLFENRRGRRFEGVGSRAGVNGSCRAAVLANLDGDRRLDLVRVTRARLVVERQQEDGTFARSYERKLENGGDVAVGTVDDDDDDDVYVLQRGPPGDDRDDLMLVNEQEGTAFREIAVPQTSEGKAESVVPIDHDGNGRTGFIVLNGKNKARGPIRLIVFR